MPHPFQDKLFVFIGTPARCSRQAARDAVTIIGGVVDERITVFTHYAVAFSGAEDTKVYEKASERDRYGFLILLTEEQFFAILEGKADPPPKKKPPRKKGVIISEAIDPEAHERDFEDTRKSFINRKRLVSMARHGVPVPNGGRVKTDLRPLDMAGQGRIAETKITIGKTATVTATVDKTNTAKAVGSGSLEVFATPLMAALMERAACEVLTDALDEGQTSVGTSISVDHVSASPLGSAVSATATITAVNGRRIEYELSASDEQGPIGNGTHTRMIVDSKRFIEKARNKNK